MSFYSAHLNRVPKYKLKRMPKYKQTTKNKKQNKQKTKLNPKTPFNKSYKFNTFSDRAEMHAQIFRIKFAFYCALGF